MKEKIFTAQLLELLRNPEIYPVQTKSVELVQTHISWLFLTDTHVFKIKKPVNFGFLDFSTVELRRHYCYEELRLNRRLCPDIYEQVVELRATECGPTFSRNGEVIDYAVIMKRLPADRMLDRLIDNGTITVEEIRLVALEICRFHANAAISPHINEFGSLEIIRLNWQENFDQTVEFDKTTLPRTVRETIRTYTENFTAKNQTIFSERVEKGFIRDCDGDIHSGNICIVDNKAFIFDCIEFNERFRFSDTAADIAFLLMDLDYHSRHDLADVALATYVQASGDTALEQVVTFYKVYRAFVRGKVASLQLLDAGISAHERSLAEKHASRYFRLAQGYCLQSRLPLTLFITCGTMGCGKSTLAKQLAFELGLESFNSDIVRKKLAGLAPTQRVNVLFGLGLYSNGMTASTYSELERLTDAELALGHSVIVDAGFGTAALRARFGRLATSRKAKFVILFTTCDPDVQQRRLLARATANDSVSDGRIELLETQKNTFVPPVDSEGAIIDCSTNGTVELALNSVYSHRMFSS